MIECYNFKIYDSKGNDNPSIEDSNQDYFLTGVHPKRVWDLDSYLLEPGVLLKPLGNG